MSVIIPKRERRKLAGIASRLASPHDGERAAAALLCSRRLAELGLDWAGVVSRALAEPRPPPQPKRRATPSTAAVLARLRWLVGAAWPHLTAAEAVWLIGQHDAGGPFAPDAVERINRIVQRVERLAGARCGADLPW